MAKYIVVSKNVDWNDDFPYDTGNINIAAAFETKEEVQSFLSQQILQSKAGCWVDWDNVHDRIDIVNGALEHSISEENSPDGGADVYYVLDEKFTQLDAGRFYSVGRDTAGIEVLLDEDKTSGGTEVKLSLDGHTIPIPVKILKKYTGKKWLGANAPVSERPWFGNQYRFLNEIADNRPGIDVKKILLDIINETLGTFNSHNGEMQKEADDAKYLRNHLIDAIEKDIHSAGLDGCRLVIVTNGDWKSVCLTDAPVDAVTQFAKEATCGMYDLYFCHHGNYRFEIQSSWSLNRDSNLQYEYSNADEWLKGTYPEVTERYTLEYSKQIEGEGKDYDERQ